MEDSSQTDCPVSLMSAALTPRLKQLRDEVFLARTRCGNRVLCDSSEQAAFEQLLLRVCVDARGRPPVLRKAAFLELFATSQPVIIRPGELIVGSQRFLNTQSRLGTLDAAQRSEVDLPGNNGHIILDYGRVVRVGLPGLREAVRAMAGGTDREEANRQAFARVVEAAVTYAQRHAEAAAALAEACDDSARKVELLRIASACRHLALRPPESFPEALQLVWFTHVLLHAEGRAAAVSFGRLDQYLWPLLQRDLDAHRLTLEDAEEWLGCFWLKCCEAGESQNVTVGGVDRSGRSAENPLTLLCVQVARRLSLWQPSLSVRLGPQSGRELWDEAIRLAMLGTGQPSFFNDPVVTRALQAAGVPDDRAWDWGIVGCYEATTQGDSTGWTVNGQLILPQILLRFLEEEPADAPDFEQFLRRFTDFLALQYEAALPTFERFLDQRHRDDSPWQAVCLSGCIESGRTVEQGGASIRLFGVNVLGLGTLIDSLLAIQNLLFSADPVGLPRLREQLRGNWPDERLRQRAIGQVRHFGSDRPESNAVARRVGAFVADMVLARRLRDGTQPYPGLFRFGADIMLDVPATPDGRRQGDRLSYGAGPSELAGAIEPTAVMRAAALAAHDRCACGNPLLLSFSPDVLRGPAGHDRLRHLIITYFQQGGSHLHVNLINGERLREAQRHPERAGHLLVRISGFSAPFVSLNPRWQEAIIARTQQGI